MKAWPDPLVSRHAVQRVVERVGLRRREARRLITRAGSGAVFMPGMRMPGHQEHEMWYLPNWDVYLVLAPNDGRVEGELGRMVVVTVIDGQAPYSVRRQA